MSSALSEPQVPKKQGSRSPAADRKSISSVTSVKEKRKYLQRGIRKRNSDLNEGSDDSDDNESMESEQTNSNESKQGKGPKARRPSREWVMVEGLKDGQKFETKPDKYEGWILKRRNWPLKGWHKRYFVLENGYLTYAKHPGDISRGKYHGQVDIGLSVLTYKKHRRRIDIDAEDFVYHLKAIKSQALFEEWISRMRVHRLYRQNEIAFGTRDTPKLVDVTTPVDDMTPLTSPVTNGTPFSDIPGISRGSFSTRSIRERSQTKVAAWLLDTAGIEQCNKELSAAQAKIFELGTMVEKLNTLNCVNLYASENVFEDHKTRKALWRGKKEHKKSQDRLSVAGLSVPSQQQVPLHASSSNPNLVAHELENKNRPNSLPEQLEGIHDQKLQELKLRDDFISTAKLVHENLRTLARTVGNERERFKHALEQENGVNIGTSAYTQQLKIALAEALKQNTEMRAKLDRIHAESSMTSIQPSPAQEKPPRRKVQWLDPYSSSSQIEDHTLLATSGSWESTSDFFVDAEEHLNISTEESSEGSDEDEGPSDLSDQEYMAAPSSDDGLEISNIQTGRRSKLPCPRPEGANVSLWGLLKKNIGKDLSKVSMPVALNEPLSNLQRLCEELEYSELLDKAAEVEDPFERMVLVAAFTVSPYAATYYRAGQKPFNPLLGETYECIREDKGWKYIAEQVSHHPPISACYCESKNFIFSQDIKVKTKFWGKSMEIQPVGTLTVRFPHFRETYTWNKVTTCVHNILGGQRCVDHYGEVLIKNDAKGITCKLTYAKSRYWSNSKHEVYGSVYDSEGQIIHQLFGKWNEGFYYGHAPSAKCIWRPGVMPEDYELYYGFTRFAIELNELNEDNKDYLPPTDTRFRPDQRALEEGKLQEAENEKIRLEQLQRERRKQRELEKVVYSPRWFMKDEDDGKEIYRYTGKYFELRKEFPRMQFTNLW